MAQIAPSFRVNYYTTENGLPSNGLKGLQWDEKTGFLWMATEAGIVRFNGIDFKTYTNKNSALVTAERIRFIIRNRKGTIYAVDDAQNILKVNQNEIVLQPSINASRTNIFRAFYALIASDTFFHDRIRHPTVQRFEFYAGFTVLPLTDTSVIFSKDGRLFFITPSTEVPLVFDNTTINRAFKIGEQIFLVSRNSDVFRANLVTNKIAPVRIRGTGFLPDDYTKEGSRIFSNTGSANPVLISGRKAWQLTCDSSGIVASPICDSIPDNVRIMYVQYSPEKKLLFLGTDSKGLIVISQNRISVVRKKSITINTTVAYYSQIELPGNNILTSEGHVIGESEKSDVPLPLQGKLSFNIYTINDSLLWFARSNDQSGARSINCYNYKTGLITAYPKILSGNHFAISYSKGNYYVATDSGLGVLQQDSLYFLFKRTFQNGIEFSPYSMAEISPGVFLIACCSQLIRFDLATNTADTIVNDPTGCFRTLWKYKDYLFIGTYGKGYYVYKNGKMKAMPLDKNNFLAYTHCFMSDNYGYCWISTNRGLFKVRIADMINAYEEDNTKLYYHYIGRRDGMDITEMNGGCTPCALQMKSGIISFPTMDGLAWVNPKDTATILPEGKIFIDEIIADSKKLNADSLASKALPAKTHEIMIRLGFSAWCNKENLYIEYELNNSGKWNPVDVGDDAVIRLYEFNKGNNKLRIRKMNGFGTGNYSYETFNFRVNTPWYREWWFYVLTGLCAIGFVWIIFKLRTRQYVIQQRKLEQQVSEKTKELQQMNAILQKNDTIKTRLISIISHDIITPLKFLTVTGKNLRQKRALMPEELQQEALDEITNTSQEIHLLSTNILNWIKYQNENRRLLKEVFNVHELVNEVRGLLNSLAKEKGLELSNEVDKDLLLLQYPEPLKILIYNFVSNAIRFSETGKIVIVNGQKEGNVIIGVRDEGIGMTTEQIHNIMSDQIIISSARTDFRKGNGLGYLIIKDLMRLIDVSITIESEKGKGTIVSVHVPVKKVDKHQVI